MTNPTDQSKMVCKPANVVMRYLDPTNDYAFKRLFGDERRKEILISFLNSILQLEGDQTIEDVTLLDPNQAPHMKGAKASIVDVRCRDHLGTNYIVEMQVISHGFFDKRVLYYTAKAYSSQLKKADRFPELKPVIFLGILNFSFLKSDAYVSTHIINDVETQEHVLRDFQFTFVELPKFVKTENELVDITDKWVYFLKNASDLKSVPSAIYENAIKEAFEVIDRAAWDEQELDSYESSYNEMRERHSFFHGGVDQGIPKGVEIGKAEGIEIGKAEGIEIGKAEGIEIGKAEGIEIGKLEGLAEGEKRAMKKLVVNLLQAGSKEDYIAAMTGLSQSEVAAITASLD